MDKISLKAPAKINLYLSVIGKRKDGYHNIESLMQTIDLYDEITLEKSDILELECDDPLLPESQDNIALKAAAIFQDKIYFPGVKITLKKNIPFGSGLGGGSSDAAFVLRGLIDLYNLKLTNAEKMDIAARIGSDVPFFLSEGQAIVTGRGETIKSVRIPLDYQVVLIVPRAKSSTAEAYNKVKISLTRENRPSLLQRKIEPSSFYKMIGLFSNDLEKAVLTEMPELGDYKNLLMRYGAVFSSLTGSGSAVFGVYRLSDFDIGRIKKSINNNCRVFFCRPITIPTLL